VFNRITLTSPRYAASIKPGELAMVRPWFKAFPLRGSTNPA
jgi:hypothetical protein